MTITEPNDENPLGDPKNHFPAQLQPKPLIEGDISHSKDISQSSLAKESPEDSWQRIKIHVEDLLNREVPDFSAYKKKSLIKTPQQINITGNLTKLDCKDELSQKISNRFKSKSEFIHNTNPTYTGHTQSSALKKSVMWCDTETSGKNKTETGSVGNLSETSGQKPLNQKSHHHTCSYMNIVGLSSKLNPKTRRQKQTLRKLNSMRLDGLYNFIDAKQVQINYQISKN